MSRPRILVVEDEPAIADTIVYALSTDGFEPHWCATGGAALEAVRARPCALAVLDVGLPDINGFELFKQLQRVDPGLPAIFLTARSSEIDRVVGVKALRRIEQENGRMIQTQIRLLKDAAIPLDVSERECIVAEQQSAVDSVFLKFLDWLGD